MKHRFLALDGMRGICALVVLIFHTFCYAPFNPLPYGYLSVDVFFVLSGFVIAFAFADKLAAGLGLLGFLKARVCRLGPVDLFGSVFAGLVFAVAGFANGFPSIAIAVLKNWLLIPSPGTGDQLAFPLNAPTWSLFAEFWVNVAFALIVARLTIQKLIGVVVCGFAAVAGFTLFHGTMNFGGTSEYVLVALLRAVPAFACGILIFRLWKVGKLARVPDVPAMAIFSAWLALSALPIPSFGGMYELFVVLLFVPSLIVLLVRSKSTMPAWTLWMGRISYPLYASHFVLVYAADRFTKWHPNAFTEIAVMTLSIGIADAVARWYEPAVRRALSTLTLPSATALATR